MTVNLLNDYRNIRREIDEIETELNCKHYEVDSVSTCTPPSYTAHSKRIEGYLPDGNTLSLLARLSDLRTKRRAVDEWADGIDDMEIRRIVLRSEFI